MPGIIYVRVWMQCAGSATAFEHQKTKTVAVFDAVPGSPWAGFSTFLMSLAREYDTTQIQLGEVNSKENLADTPPELGTSLLARRPEDLFTFPHGGTLALTVFVFHKAPPQAVLSNTLK